MRTGSSPATIGWNAMCRNCRTRRRSKPRPTTPRAARANRQRALVEWEEMRTLLGRTDERCEAGTVRYAEGTQPGSSSLSRTLSTTGFPGCTNRGQGGAGRRLPGSRLLELRVQSKPGPIVKRRSGTIRAQPKPLNRTEGALLRRGPITLE